MSYNVVQKIRNNYYLYEVTSVWDPITRRSKQKRKYLGRCDEQGNLLVEDCKMVESYDLGDYWLLYQISVQCGLWGAITKVFNKVDAGLFLTICMTRCLRNIPPPQATYAVKASFMPEYLGAPLDSNWLTMSTFLNSLQSIYDKRGDIFRGLPHDGSVDVIELDIFSTPLRFYRLYGHVGHRNFNNFPQKSIFVAQGKETNQPFYFRFANYSGSDVDTLKDIVSELKDMNVGKVHFFLGVKYYTEQEIAAKISIDYSLSLILTNSCPLATQLLLENMDLSEYSTAVESNMLYRYKKFKRYFGAYPCDVWMIHNGRTYEESMLSFYAKLSEFESVVSKMKWSKTLHRRLETAYGFSDIMMYYALTEADDGGVAVSRVESEIRKYEMTLGKTIIITNKDLTLSEISALMDRYDRLSQDLTIFKTDLQGGAPLFPSNESAVASLMCDFGSMIMKTALINRMSASGLDNMMTYLDVFSETRTIKQFKVNGAEIINPLTESQAMIYKTLGVDPPSMMKKGAGD